MIPCPPARVFALMNARWSRPPVVSHVPAVAVQVYIGKIFAGRHGKIVPNREGAGAVDVNKSLTGGASAERSHRAVRNAENLVTEPYVAWRSGRAACADAQHS